MQKGGYTFTDAYKHTLRRDNSHITYVVQLICRLFLFEGWITVSLCVSEY